MKPTHQRHHQWERRLTSLTCKPRDNADSRPNRSLQPIELRIHTWRSFVESTSLRCKTPASEQLLNVIGFIWEDHRTDCLICDYRQPVLHHLRVLITHSLKMSIVEYNPSEKVHFACNPDQIRPVIRGGSDSKMRLTTRRDARKVHRTNSIRSDSKRIH